MPNWENVMVDTEQMESGKFYKIYTNSNNATLLIPKENEEELEQKVNNNTNDIILLKQSHVYAFEIKFYNERYIEMIIPNGLWINGTSIYETVREDEQFLVERDMTHSMHIEIKKNKNTGEQIVYTHSNQPITGRMIIILNPLN